MQLTQVDEAERLKLIQKQKVLQDQQTLKTLGVKDGDMFVLQIKRSSTNNSNECSSTSYVPSNEKDTEVLSVEEFVVNKDITEEIKPDIENLKTMNFNDMNVQQKVEYMHSVMGFNQLDKSYIEAIIKTHVNDMNTIVNMLLNANI